jgi:C4-dicarboxylate-specific signal transduction histidine kinase
MVNVGKNGSVIFVENSILPIRDAERRITGFRGISREVTERKRMEEEKRQLEQKAQLASRLASVGEMASGIAHEINNPLTGVIGYAQLLLQEDLPDNIRKDLETINDGAQRVANVIQRLLAFARQTKPQRTYVNINEVLATTLDLRGYHLQTSNIKITKHLAPDLPLTVADAGQLQQVFLNLIVNAETEMNLARGHGKLTVKTQRINDTIRISFNDDGGGISEENLERIFDPFFTTRQVGQGTGLGLSVCYGIVS